MMRLSQSALWVCLAMFIPVSVIAQNSPFSQQAPNLQQQSTAPNTLTQTAVAMGALTCAARIQKVTSYLGASPDGKVFIRRPANPPDSNSIGIDMNVQVDNTSGLAHMEFYPSPQGCAASYSIIINFPKPCTEVRTSSFGNLNESGKLTENITGLTSPNGLRVFLIDHASACTVVKSETIER